MDLSKLLSIAGGYDATRTIHVGVKLGVFDILHRHGPSPSESMARLMRCHPRGAELLLNALAGQKLLIKRGNKFSLAALSKKYLTKASPTSYAHMIEFMEESWQGWSRLEEAVRKGHALEGPPTDKNSRRSLENFIMGMHNIATVRGDAAYMAKRIPLRGYRTLVDIGGGPGTYSIALCQANRMLKATVFDLPETLKITRKVLQNHDRTRRVSVKPGNYHEDSLGGPYDVALLSNIIHSENEHDNLKLMKKIFKSLNPGGLVIIKDHILTKDLTQPVDGAIFALTMLLFTKGRCYSLEEIQDWFKKAGFEKGKRLKAPKNLTSDYVLCHKP
jgi:2-polyprenyl-3-methyl-5-hydroxy-6-metoxy-1,4-benzoquinol methylase